VIPILSSGVLVTGDEAAVILVALKRLDASLTGAERVVVNRFAKSAAKTGVWSTSTASSPTKHLPAGRIENAPANARWLAIQAISAQHERREPLSTADAAAALGITPNGVRDLRRRGALRAERVGGRWKFDPAEIAARIMATTSKE
jgi:hypothetical protein